MFLFIGSTVKRQGEEKDASWKLPFSLWVPAHLLDWTCQSPQPVYLPPAGLLWNKAVGTVVKPRFQLRGRGRITIFLLGAKKSFQRRDVWGGKYSYCFLNVPFFQRSKYDLEIYLPDQLVWFALHFFPGKSRAKQYFSFFSKGVNLAVLPVQFRWLDIGRH